MAATSKQQAAPPLAAGSAMAATCFLSEVAAPSSVHRQPQSRRCPSLLPPSTPAIHISFPLLPATRNIITPISSFLSAVPRFLLHRAPCSPNRRPPRHGRHLRARRRPSLFLLLAKILVPPLPPNSRRPSPHGLHGRRPTLLPQPEDDAAASPSSPTAAGQTDPPLQARRRSSLFLSEQPPISFPCPWLPSIIHHTRALLLARNRPQFRLSPRPCRCCASAVQAIARAYVEGALHGSLHTRTLRAFFTGRDSGSRILALEHNENGAAVTII